MPWQRSDQLTHNYGTTTSARIAQYFRQRSELLLMPCFCIFFAFSMASIQSERKCALWFVSLARERNEQNCAGDNLGLRAFSKRGSFHIPQIKIPLSRAQQKNGIQSSASQCTRHRTRYEAHTPFTQKHLYVRGVIIFVSTRILYYTLTDLSIGL